MFNVQLLLSLLSFVNTSTLLTYYMKMSSPLSTEKNSKSNVCVTSNGKCFLAVHSGAGNHSKANESHNKNICKTACMQAMELLKSKGSAIDAVTAAVMALENDESTNAGYGSNLNVQGDAECEACVMDGASLYFGGVGALSGIKNPVNVANLLVKEQIEGPLPFGRVRPSILVGKGAKTFCADRGIDTNYNMISKSAFKTYSRYKRKCCLSDSNDAEKRRKVEQTAQGINTTSKADEKFTTPSELIQDTVGAICVDQEGNVAAASSSGGIWLKHPGRLGPISVYGAGCWAQNQSSDTKPGVAVVTSGCGEHIMQTILAKTCSDGIRSPGNLSQSLPQVFNSDFLESEFLSTKPEKHGGVLALKFSEAPDGKEVELGWIHSTNNFCFAFMGGDQKTPKALMSSLEEHCNPGKSYTMGGHVVFL